MNKNSIAIFGGSFNPPTIAHINLAKQILDKMKNIEKIIFVPVSTKYNKQGLAPDEDRLELLKTICQDHPNMEVSSLELNSPRQLYTIETLKIMQKQNPDKTIYFIVGTDNLKELETWHAANEILQQFKIIVLERDNDIMEKIISNSLFLKQYRESFIKLNFNKIKLSSSYIRQKVQMGEEIKELVPEKIYKDILRIYKKEEKTSLNYKVTL